MTSLLKFTSVTLGLLLLAGCFGGANVKQNVSANVESEVIEIPSKAADDFKIAIQLMNEEKVDQARVQFEKMTTEFPQLAGPFANLGVIYAKKKEWDKAEEMLEIASEKNKKNVKVMNQLGLIYRQQGKFNKAEAVYKKAIKTAPAESMSYKNIGILYDIYMGQFVKASEFYQKYQAMQSEPDRQVAGWIVDINRRAGIKPKAQIAAEAP